MTRSTFCRVSCAVVLFISGIAASKFRRGRQYESIAQDLTTIAFRPHVHEIEHIADHGRHSPSSALSDLPTPLSNPKCTATLLTLRQSDTRFTGRGTRNQIPRQPGRRRPEIEVRGQNDPTEQFSFENNTCSGQDN